MSHTIIDKKSELTSDMRKRMIDMLDIYEIDALFGGRVGEQMRRDKQSLFPLWDSCSMIEQSWENLDATRPVEDFVKWFWARVKQRHVEA